MTKFKWLVVVKNTKAYNEIIPIRHKKRNKCLPSCILKIRQSPSFLQESQDSYNVLCLSIEEKVDSNIILDINIPTSLLIEIKST